MQNNQLSMKCLTQHEIINHTLQPHITNTHRNPHHNPHDNPHHNPHDNHA